MKQKNISRLTNMVKTIELTLCPVCAQQFYSSGFHHIRRASAWQAERDICTYCNIRYGVDFLISRVEVK